ncbi:MAG: hypothetical protein HXX81_01980 [Campylobacterales bacterium]|nr:hypothetical protein [Campylobacterales bacterium]
MYSEHFSEHYHSVKDGALKESLKKHIIPAFENLPQKESYKILDICFGLGYNTLTTLLYLENRDVKIEIYSPEFDLELIKSLKNFEYPKEFEKFKHIIEILSDKLEYKNDKIFIKIFNQDAREMIKKCDVKFDIVFHDAFSPKKNPLLWSYEYFKQIKSIMNEKAILTTYSVASPVRLALFENGFYIYEYKSDVRNSTIATNFKSENLVEFDMQQKLKNAPNTKMIRDIEVAS